MSAVVANKSFLIKVAGVEHFVRAGVTLADTGDAIYTASPNNWDTYVGATFLAGGEADEVLTKQSGDDGDADWEAPAGGSLPITCEELSSNGVIIADADGAWVPWDTTAGPDTLIDRTVPAHPTIITTGVYMVSVVVSVNSITPAGWFDAGLHLDRGGFNASMYAKSNVRTVADSVGTVSDVTLAFAWYITAGNQVGVFVDNHDGAEARGFEMLYAHIQRIS